MLTKEQLKDARDWIKDCSWREDEDSNDWVDELTPEQIERGIEKNYGGGIAGFLDSYQ